MTLVGQTNMSSSRSLLAGHPLVQNEKCLHAFLLEQRIDKEGFVPGKVAR